MTTEVLLPSEVLDSLESASDAAAPEATTPGGNGKQTAPDPDDDRFRDDAPDLEPPIIRPPFERGDHAELADRLLVELAPVRERVVHSDGAIWRYLPVSGYFEQVDVESLKRIVKGFAGLPRKTGDGPVPMRISAGAVNGAIELASAEVHSETFFLDAPPGLAFANGFVRIEEGDVAVDPHSIKNRCRLGFPFDYDKKAKHPKLDEFLEDLFADVEEQERTERIDLLQEFIGAALLGLATSYQKCLVLFGEGDRGKSQVAEVIRSLFPSFAICSIAPHRWPERFGVTGLVGKSLNLVAELPDAELIGTDMFKSVVTGDMTGGERKFMPEFQFKPTAAHIFLANTLPATQDFTYAFFRRFLICHFTRNMRLAECHREDAARSIIEGERAAIVSWSVAGAARLQAQHRYTEPKTSEEILGHWRTDCDSVATFVEERCRRLEPGLSVTGNGLRSTVLYPRYKSWATDHAYKPVSLRTFASRMGSLKLWGVRGSDGVYYPVDMGGYDA